MASRFILLIVWGPDSGKYAFNNTLSRWKKPSAVFSVGQCHCGLGYVASYMLWLSNLVVQGEGTGCSLWSFFPTGGTIGSGESSWCAGSGGGARQLVYSCSSFPMWSSSGLWCRGRFHSCVLRFSSGVCPWIVVHLWIKHMSPGFRDKRNLKKLTKIMM